MYSSGGWVVSNSYFGQSKVLHEAYSCTIKWKFPKSILQPTMVTSAQPSQIRSGKKEAKQHFTPKLLVVPTGITVVRSWKLKYQPYIKTIVYNGDG